MLNVIVTNQQHHARQTVLDISQTWKTRKIHKAFFQRPGKAPASQLKRAGNRRTGEQEKREQGSRGTGGGAGEEGSRRGGEEGNRRRGEQGAGEWGEGGVVGEIREGRESGKDLM